MKSSMTRRLLIISLAFFVLSWKAKSYEWRLLEDYPTDDSRTTTVQKNCSKPRK